jgi:hypothetical protein
MKVAGVAEVAGFFGDYKAILFTFFIFYKVYSHVSLELLKKAASAATPATFIKTKQIL